MKQDGVFEKIQEAFAFIGFFNQAKKVGIEYQFSLIPPPGEPRLLFTISADGDPTINDNTNPDPHIETSKRLFEHRWLNKCFGYNGRQQESGKIRFFNNFSEFIENELKELNIVPLRIQREYKDIFDSYISCVRNYTPPATMNGNATIQNKTKGFKIDQIGLLLAYTRRNFPDPRGHPGSDIVKIAASYGFTSPTSGQQLYNSLNGFQFQRNRIRAANKNLRIKYIEGILDEIKNDATALKLANDDLLALSKDEM